MAGRCWKGYTPVKGKKPYSPGSCRKSSGKPKGKGPKRKLKPKPKKPRKKK